MSDPAQLQLDFRRYDGIVSATLRAAANRVAMPAATTEGPAEVRLERGSAYAAAVLASEAPGQPGADPSDRLAEPTQSAELAQVAVIDPAGHRRPVYRPLLVYAWLQAFRIHDQSLPHGPFGRWDHTLRPWCDLLEARLGEIGIEQTLHSAARGDSVVEAAWTALALSVAGKIFGRDAWTRLAADAFGSLVRAQRPGGAFLAAAGNEHPELVWYHELAILHAAASYAAQAGDRPVARAVARAAEHHLKEIQPDHATSQPWGLFAFIWNPPSRPLADQLLHAASLQSRRDPVTLILLADALYCLRLFE
jgi:hypothetical protein